jgi:hypothetical protein
MIVGRQSTTVKLVAGLAPGRRSRHLRERPRSTTDNGQASLLSTSDGGRRRTARRCRDFGHRASEVRREARSVQRRRVAEKGESKKGNRDLARQKGGRYGEGGGMRQAGVGRSVVCVRERQSGARSKEEVAWRRRGAKGLGVSGRFRPKTTGKKRKGSRKGGASTRR